MNNSNYTDKQIIDIANKEYDDYEKGNIVRADKNKIIVGHVSEVNHKAWGEDSYIVTDVEMPENPSAEDYAKVKNVTILYQGSTAKLISHPIKTLTDWGPNNLPMGITILAPEALIPQRAPQMEEASETLQKALKTYPNAKIDIFAHFTQTIGDTGVHGNAYQRSRICSLPVYLKRKVSTSKRRIYC